MQPSDKNELLREPLARAVSRARQVSNTPDSKTLEEEEDLDREQHKALVKSLNQDIAERKRYAVLFFALASCWLLVIVVVLLLQGFGSFWFGRMPFRLSENVVLAVIGSTTVNVIGILYVVANYLFPKK